MVLTVCGPVVDWILAPQAAPAPALALKAHAASQQHDDANGMLLALRAVNFSKLSPSLPASQRAAINVNAALQFIASSPAQLSFVPEYFLREAAKLHGGSDSHAMWAVTPSGKAFVKAGSWVGKCSPNYRAVSQAFARSQLVSVMMEVLSGTCTGHDEVVACVADMPEAESEVKMWTSILRCMLSVRQGQDVDPSMAVVPQDDLQRAMIAALQAQMDLAVDVDESNNHVQTASLLLRNYGEPTDVLQRVAWDLAWRQVLSVRATLLRMMADMDCEQQVQELQCDLVSLRSFTSRPAVASLVFLYSAVSRSLVNSRDHPTRHLFAESIKAARRAGLAHDEGLAVMYMAVCLRTAMPAAALRSALEKASSIFQSLGAKDELTLTRSLQKTITA